MNILIIDNYDSFTFNLYHLIEPLVSGVSVVRNDNIDYHLVADFDKVILSPGPGLPSESNQLLPFIDYFHTQKSILGICLGHQAIGQFFGCKLLNLDTVKHGEKTILNHVDQQEPLFCGIEQPMEVGHYHSWVLDPNHIGSDIKVTSNSNDMIMSISHKKYDLKGLQFHPESILTPMGAKLLRNWILI